MGTLIDALMDCALFTAFQFAWYLAYRWWPR